MGSCFTVSESTVAAVEQWGQFSYIATPGCYCVGPGTTKAHVLPLRLRQTEVKVDTRTKDNVFVGLHLLIQWAVIQDPSKCLESELEHDPKKKKGEKDAQIDTTKKDLSHMTKEDFFYKAVYATLSPESQLRSLTEEYFRIVVVKHKLDRLFDLGSTITSECRHVLNRSMNEYGYYVKKIVITDIQPEKTVTSAMNDIVASEKEREAARIRAEAEKIQRIKAAEAQAEVARLQGEGIARQRFAITKGLRQSVEEFSDATGADPASVMSLLMLTQHTDMIKESLGHSKAVNIILEASIDKPGELPQSQLRRALLSTNPVTTEVR